MSTLYEKIGGEEAIDAAVKRFYKKVLADNRIKHFFQDTDMKKQANHQKLFLSYAFGGKQGYSGRSMCGAHQHLVEKMGLSDEHFDVVLEILTETLKELGVSDDLISIAASITESKRNEVLNKVI